MVACDVSRRHPPENLRCPRCDSPDTKFCYYNNYNTSQPRHFCKSCKRYWTAGGSLRNVPVGGGLRKNKKSKLVNQVKDMVTSSSSDELFQGNSLTVNSPYVFSQDGLPHEAPGPLSFAPPVIMASTSSSADVNAYAYRSLNPIGYGYFAENCINDFATAGVDPSLVNSMSRRQQSQFQADYGRALPDGVHRHVNGVALSPHVLAEAVQAHSQGAVASEAPSELLKVSLDANEEQNLHSAIILHGAPLDMVHVHDGNELKKLPREESADLCVCTGQESVCELGKVPKQEMLSPSMELRDVEDNQLRDGSSAEGEEDDLGNVVNVRYPYDWEQVSEVLFGGTPDFFQLSGSMVT